MGVKIDCDIPGGNIIVLSSNENGAVLKKDLRDTSTDWFYWCFRAAFDKAGEYEFRFEPADSPARLLYNWIGSEKSIEIIEANSSLSVVVGESVILKYDS